MEFDNMYDDYQMKKMRQMKKMKGGNLGNALLNLGSAIGSDFVEPLINRTLEGARQKRLERLAAQRAERAAQRAAQTQGGSLIFDRLKDVGGEFGNIFNSVSNSLAEADRQNKIKDAAEYRARISQARIRGKGRKSKGGVLGIRNFGIVDYFRGNRDNPDNHDRYNPSTPEDAKRDFERDIERRRRRIIDSEGFDMVGRNEIDDAIMAANMRNPQTGIELAGQGASGGFLLPLLAANAMGINPISEARKFLGFGLKGGFLPELLLANAMGVNPVKAISGLFGFGNNNDIVFIPDDKKNEKQFKMIHKGVVKGGAVNLNRPIGFSPSTVMKNMVKGIIGLGDDGIYFEPTNKKDSIYLKNFGMKKIKGGSQFWKDFGKGFSMVMGPASSLAGMAAMFPPLTPYAAPLSMATGILNSGVKALTGNGTTGGADPREYRHHSVTARPQLLQMANSRGIETSQAKGDAGGAYGGYVHRPSSYHGSGQNLYAGSCCPDMKRTVGSGSRSERAAIVKQVMNERGVSMIEASRIVKKENMY
jgi:hypothetical protein